MPAIQFLPRHSMIRALQPQVRRLRPLSVPRRFSSSSEGVSTAPPDLGQSLHRAALHHCHRRTHVLRSLNRCWKALRTHPHVPLVIAPNALRRSSEEMSSEQTTSVGAITAEPSTKDRKNNRLNSSQ